MPNTPWPPPSTYHTKSVGWWRRLLFFSWWAHWFSGPLIEARVASPCLCLIERPQTVHTRVAVSKVKCHIQHPVKGENSGRIILFPSAAVCGSLWKRRREGTGGKKRAKPALGSISFWINPTRDISSAQYLRRPRRWPERCNTGVINSSIVWNAFCILLSLCALLKWQVSWTAINFPHSQCFHDRWMIALFSLAIFSCSKGKNVKSNC